MNYSLGNTLSRGGSLNADGLSLDLQFATDKTLTARKGPTPVFTRASTATFVGSDGLIQSAAINQARFDHDPSTLVSKGLLIEESRTNSVLNSDNFSGSGWTLFGATLQTVSVTNPSGGTTSQKLVEGILLDEHGIFRSMGTTGTVTMSIFVKEAGRRFCYLRRDGAGNAVFDLVLGTVTAGSNAVITAAGNGWFRISFVTTEVGNWVFKLSDVGTGVLNSRAYLGDGSSGVLIWGAQLEAGAFPTSYIPTTTASVVRSADVCSITGSAFTGIWSGVDATMFFRGARIANQTEQVNWDLSSGTTATSISSDRGASTERIVANAAGIMTTSVFTTLAEYKIAAALKTGDYAVSFNGASVVTSSSAFVLTLDRMTIGMTRGSAGQLNGWIHSIRFYKKRLANSKLVTLTV